MADPRFFRRKGPFTLGRLAEITGAALSEGADPAKEMTDVAPLGAAGPDELSFLDNRKYLDAFRSSAAGAASTPSPTVNCSHQNNWWRL